MIRAELAGWRRDSDQSPLRPLSTPESAVSGFMLLLFFTCALFAVGLSITLS